jgi:hypothetical protein
LVRGLFVWASAAVLVDFVVLGLLLRWDLPPWAVFALAGVNPLQSGRVGLVAAIDPELGALGPVGTWAVVAFGPHAAVAWGLGWPFLIGAGALWLARRRFLREDVL